MTTDKEDHHTIETSWEFIEYCEKNEGIKLIGSNQNRDDVLPYLHKHLSQFCQSNSDIVEKLNQREKENFVDCGIITELSHKAGVYSFVLRNIRGTGMTMSIPDELLAKSVYTPKEGDRITLVEGSTFTNGSTSGRHSTGKHTLYLRKNNQDLEIYRINENSEEYKAIKKAAKERISIYKARTKTSKSKILSFNQIKNIFRR